MTRWYASWMLLACARCLHRQAAEGPCAKCGADSIFDLRSRAARELFEGNEARARDRRDARIRMTSALVALGGVIALYAGLLSVGLVPNGPSVLVLAIGVAVGVTGVLERMLGRGAPSILTDLPPPELP